MLRGIAALAVFIGHERNLFFVDYPSVANPNIFITALYFAGGFGHQAVIIFFVLSGLLISSSIIEARQTGRWSWKRYVTARLSRLLVVLIPALMLGAFWDQLGMLLFGLNGIYGANPSVSGNVISFPVDQRSSLWTGIGNAMFLQEIVVPTFGSNSALWSLSYEFWYYILFPLGLAIFWPSVSRTARLTFGLASFLLLIFVGQTIALYFLIWLIGAALAILPPLPSLYSSRRRRLVCNVLGVCLVVGCLFAIRAGVLGAGAQADFVLALAFAFLVYTVLHSSSLQSIRSRDVYGTVANSAAGFSYTLYVVHLPFFVFLQASLLSGERWQPDAIHLSSALVIFTTVLSYAFLLSRVTEARTNDVRGFVLSVIGHA